MARKKKDGRFINYYIDRLIYERLERYAEDKGQPVTAALERILDESLTRYELEAASVERYCPNCHILVRAPRCPLCDRKWLEQPLPEDYCLLGAVGAGGPLSPGAVGAGGPPSPGAVGAGGPPPPGRCRG